jgi:3-oxoacyl-[acyl-carrier-protein] synthase II
MPYARRIVVTGIGVVSPLGRTRAEFSDSLRSMRSGVKRIQMFDPSTLSVQIAAEIPDFDPRLYLEKKDRKSLKMMARTVQFAVAASRLAVDDSGLTPAEYDPARFGVVFGSSTLPGELTELAPAAVASYDISKNEIDLQRWGAEGMFRMQPMFMLNHVPNMATCHVSILHNAQGPNNTITQTDVAGLLAIGEAMRVIQRGTADLMLTGGADTRTPLVAMIRYPLFNQLSRRNDSPESACRPFDRTRDGMVMGEGAGVFMLEDLDHAKNRNARIIAEAVGFAAGFDPGRSGKGLARVIRRAMSEAGITNGDLDHVNAHAPGTTEDDAWEARAIAETVGEVPVAALKSQMGNLGAAGAAVELAGSLVGLERGWRPGTLNYRELDTHCPIRVSRESGAGLRPYVLKVSGTEMGQCAALIVRRWWD